MANRLSDLEKGFILELYGYSEQDINFDEIDRRIPKGKIEVFNKT